GRGRRYALRGAPAAGKLVAPLEVLCVVTGDLDPPRRPSRAVDLHRRAEGSLQLCFQPALGGLARLRCTGPLGSHGSRLLHLRLDPSHAPFLPHRAPGDLNHLVIVADAEERTAVSGAKTALRDVLADRRRELEEPERIRDGRAVPADDLGDLLLREPELLRELLVPCR